MLVLWPHPRQLKVRGEHLESQANPYMYPARRALNQITQAPTVPAPAVPMYLNW